MLELLAPVLFIFWSWLFWKVWDRSIVTTGGALAASALISVWIHSLPPADTVQQTLALASLVSGSILILTAVILTPSIEMMASYAFFAWSVAILVGGCLDQSTLWNDQIACQLKYTFYAGFVAVFVLVIILWKLFDCLWTNQYLLSNHDHRAPTDEI